MYTISEPNSITHLSRLEEIAPQYGFTVQSIGVTNASEVGTAAVSLCQQGVDCINNFTDNLVVENLPAVLLEMCIRDRFYIMLIEIIFMKVT